MKKVQLTGAALAIGAAAMFSTLPAIAADATAAPMVSCKGVNSCKSATNSCKGQGVTQMSQADCIKAGGTVTTDAAGAAAGANGGSSSTTTPSDGASSEGVQE